MKYNTAMNDLVAAVLQCKVAGGFISDAEASKVNDKHWRYIFDHEHTLPVVLRDNLRSQPILARSRPEAYAILPGHDHVLTRLESLGLSVERLDAPRRVPVERYVVDAYTRDPYRYEGMHRQTVHTRVDRVERELPAGSALVQLDQARGNLLPELLEPAAGWIKLPC